MAESELVWTVSEYEVGDVDFTLIERRWLRDYLLQPFAAVVRVHHASGRIDVTVHSQVRWCGGRSPRFRPCASEIYTDEYAQDWPEWLTSLVEYGRVTPV